MKNIFFILICLIISFNTLSQIEYGYERPKSSTDPWVFGVNVMATYDWISNLAENTTKTWGYKGGISGEKHLVYNIYFRPVLNFMKKSCSTEWHDEIKNEINAYVIDFEATIEMKFGDDRKGNGLILYFAPYFSYGVGGKSKQTNLNPMDTATYMTTIEFNTFDEHRIKKTDVGFVLGLGYDFNHHLEFNFNYVVGYFGNNIATNSYWRSLQFGLTYFF